MLPPDRQAAARAIDDFLRAIGRDSGKEPELVGTGARVADAFLDELCAGYAIDTKKLLEGSVIHGQAGLVAVRDVPIATTCPHHLLLATGAATIAFQARARLVGLGTLASLATAHARRLALQEQIGEAIVADLEAVLAPEWVGCRIVLAHGCMFARGACATTAKVETTALRGATSPAAIAIAHAALGVGR